MKAKKKQLRDAFIILGISVCLLGLLEGTVRVYDRLRFGTWRGTESSTFRQRIKAALPLYRNHPYLNVSPQEGMQVQAFEKQAAFNSLGYRSPERPVLKPEGTLRILCAGGSTTFDILAKSNQKTWPWQLEENLRESGLSVEVWNAGFPGWTSVENLIALSIRDLELLPDVIVFFQGINDLQPASHQPFDPQYENGHATLIRQALGLEMQPMAWHEHSVLLEKVRLLLGKPSNIRDRLVPVANEKPPTRLKSLPEEALNIFERNLRSFIAIAHTRGARVVLVTQHIQFRKKHLKEDRTMIAGWIPGLKTDSILSELKKLNDVSRRLSSEGLADLADAAIDVSWQDQDFDDPMHFSERGSQKFVDFLHQLLIEVLRDADEGIAPGH